VADWRDVVGGLDTKHRQMLEPGGLSGLFLSYPLTLANPAFVGGFYGILIAIPLLLLSVYLGELGRWLELAVVMIAITSSLGLVSLFSSMVIKRPPVRLEFRRRYLFPFPFLGLLVLGFSGFYHVGGVFEFGGLALILLPGPIYVHLSYAPRWRILRLIERGLDPFEGMRVTVFSDDYPGAKEGDSEMDEVVGDA